MDIIESLTSQLGITGDQAQGGMGLVLKLAQEKLGSDDFSSIKSLIPNSDSLLDSAPETGGAAGGLGGMLGSVLSAVGAGDLGNLATLVTGFEKLGLDKDMVMKFTPIVTDFLQGEGGDNISDIVKKLF